jgi:O-antigen/teichoic acid export membrane protein
MNRLLAFNVADTMLSLLLLALGAWWGGVDGAAASRLVYAVGWLALYAGFMHRLVRFDVRELFSIYLRSAVATVAAVAPLALVYALWVGPAGMGFPTLLAAAAVGGLCWLGALAALRHPALEEILGMASALPPLRRLAERLRPHLARSTR